MKAPKLHCLLVVLFLIFTFQLSLAQVISAPRLTSSLGDASVISFCVSETLTFSAFGDTGPNPLDFDFSPFRRNNRGLHKRLQTDNY